MQYYHSSKPFTLKNTAVACGKFDGIHLGHQELLKQLLGYRQQGLAPTVFSFDASISKVMPEQERFIYSSEERRFILEQFGIDYLAEFAFEPKLSSLSPKDFIENILVKQLGAKAIVVGEDFRFGYQRNGSVDTLMNYAAQYGYQLFIVSKQENAGGRISSSRIRQAIAAGDMTDAREMLGRHYFIIGEVVHGRQLGRTIGMPTANLTIPDYKLIPPRGVYVTRTTMNGQVYYGITNIGNKPTVNGDADGVETYLFDFEGDIYGSEIMVEFLEFRRCEQRFDSVDALARQMHQDAEYGRCFAREHKSTLH